MWGGDAAEIEMWKEAGGGEECPGRMFEGEQEEVRMLVCMYVCTKYVLMCVD